MPGVSDEQIQQAQGVDLLAYLLSRDPQSIRKCGADEYCLREHDSLKISNGKWNWHSRGFGGRSALDFLVKVRGYDFVDAVNCLTDGDVGRSHYNEHPPPRADPVKTEKPFTLPPANVNNDRVYAYLRGRGIDAAVIKQCFESKTLYERAQSHGAVFVGYDGDNPKFACERSTTDNTKKDVFGSEKRYSFCLPPETAGSTTVACFESPVDLLSHATICKMSGNSWDGHRVSLGGVGSAALTGFLERHPEITAVQLSLDNDMPGRDATARIIKELLSDSRFSHLRITVAPAPLGKDFNDTLQAIHQIQRDKSRQPDRPKEAVL